MTDSRVVLKHDLIKKLDETIETLWMLSNPRLPDYHEVIRAIEDCESARRWILG